VKLDSCESGQIPGRIGPDPGFLSLHSMKTDGPSSRTEAATCAAYTFSLKECSHGVRTRPFLRFRTRARGAFWPEEDPEARPLPRAPSFPRARRPPDADSDTLPREVGPLLAGRGSDPLPGVRPRAQHRRPGRASSIGFEGHRRRPSRRFDIGHSVSPDSAAVPGLGRRGSQPTRRRQIKSEERQKRQARGRRDRSMVPKRGDYRAPWRARRSLVSASTKALAEPASS
jgi:hypothetical protein